MTQMMKIIILERMLLENWYRDIMNSRSEKITIITIFYQSLNRRVLMDKFKCSQRMATTAKQLSFEKGVLSTPNLKTGIAIPPPNNSGACSKFLQAL